MAPVMEREPAQQDAALRQALGFENMASEFPDVGAILSMNQESFRLHIEAVGVYEERGVTVKEHRGAESHKDVQFHCRADLRCSFSLHAREERSGDEIRQRILVSRPHSCSRKEHEKFALCSEKCLLYFLRNERDWVANSTFTDANATATEAFTHHLSSKYRIDFSAGCRRRMVQRVLQKLISPSSPETLTNGSQRTDSPTTIVLEIPSNVATAQVSDTANASKLPASVETPAEGLDQPSLRPRKRTRAPTPDMRQTRSQRREDPGAVVTDDNSHATCESAHSIGDPRKRARSEDYLWNSFSRIVGPPKTAEEGQQVSSSACAETSSGTSLAHSRGPSQEPGHAPCASDVSTAHGQEQPNSPQKENSNRGTRRSRRSNAGVAPNYYKDERKVEVKPVKLSDKHRKRAPRRSIRTSVNVATTYYSDPPEQAIARSTLEGPFVSVVFVAGDRRFRAEPGELLAVMPSAKSNQPVALDAEPEVPHPWLCIQGLLRNYDALVDQGICDKMKFRGLTVADIVVEIKAKLQQLDEKFPPQPGAEVEADIRDYRKSLSSLSALRDGERLVRAQEKEEEDELRRRLEYYGRRKLTPVQAELEAMCHRKIWWVSEKEWKRGHTRKCNLGPSCSICGRGAHNKTAPPPLEVPKYRKIDINSLAETDAKEEKKYTSRKAHLREEANATRAELCKLLASLLFVDKYNKTSPYLEAESG